MIQNFHGVGHDSSTSGEAKFPLRPHERDGGSEKRQDQARAVSPVFQVHRDRVVRAVVGFKPIDTHVVHKQVIRPIPIGADDGFFRLLRDVPHRIFALEPRTKHAWEYPTGNSRTKNLFPWLSVSRFFHRWRDVSLHL